MAELLKNEVRNRRKGIRISIIVHILMLLLAFFFLLPNDPDKNIDTQQSIVVDLDFRESSLSKYAHADAGAKRKKSVEVKKVKTAPTKPVVSPKPKVELPKKTKVIETTPTEPIVSEILEDESEIEAIEEEIEIETPELEEIPEPEPEPIVDVEEVVEETIEEDIIVEETVPDSPGQPDLPPDGGEDAGPSTEGEGSDDGPSIFDGDGSGKANSGDGDGMSSGNDGDGGTGDGGAGTGVYDGSGDGIFGRKVVYRDLKGAMDLAQQSSKIVMKVCIDRAGAVTYVEIDEDQTSTRNRRLLKKAISVARNYRYEPDPKAAPEMCGKFTFNFDLSDINKFN